MRCPYCGHEMGKLPVEAIRASMRGQRMLEIFDLIVGSGDEGISLVEIVKKVYDKTDSSDPFNNAKVTLHRLKERVRHHGWTIESGSAQDSAIQQVYRIRRVG